MMRTESLTMMNTSRQQGDEDIYDEDRVSDNDEDIQTIGDDNVYDEDRVLDNDKDIMTNKERRH